MIHEPENTGILVINPGSTSTKIAFYGLDGAVMQSSSCSHSPGELNAFDTVYDQLQFRLSAVLDFLKEAGFGAPEGKPLAAVIGRGGLLAPMQGGVYAVNEAMKFDLRRAVYGEHASNLGALLAARIGEMHSCPVYIADPVVVDEMSETARFSGLPGVERRSIFHALNQKAVARSVARELGKTYEQCNFIVAHMGGGISIGAHHRGKVVDVNNALDGEGPFSPERCGTVPAGQLVQLVIDAYAREKVVPASDDELHRSIKHKLAGNGGLVGYLGINDLRSLEEQINHGDSRSGLILGAMFHQIGKEIVSHGSTLRGIVDGIILTGGMAKSALVIDEMTARLSWLAPVFVRPGEGEMQALAENAIAALNGDQPVQQYTGEGREG